MAESNDRASFRTISASLTGAATASQPSLRGRSRRRGDRMTLPPAAIHSHRTDPSSLCHLGSSRSASPVLVPTHTGESPSTSAHRPHAQAVGATHIERVDRHHRHQQQREICPRPLSILFIAVCIGSFVWLLLVLVLVVHPMQQQMARLQSEITRRPEIEASRLARWQQRRCDLMDTPTLTEEPAPVTPPLAAFLPSADAAPITETNTRLYATGEEDRNGDATTEFDIFSDDHLSRQLIVVYRPYDDDGGSTPGPPDQQRQRHTNITRSLLMSHRPHLHLLMELVTLPGSVFLVNLVGVDDDGLVDSDRRAAFLQSLLDGIRSHPAVLFLSTNRLLSLSGSTDSVRGGAYVPPGVRRIHAGSRSTTSRPADVAVAVMDTGINLNSQFINARHGINCIAMVDKMTKRYQQASADLEWLNRESDSLVYESESDAWAEPSDRIDHPLADDDNNHGTHVAGIIGGLNKAGSVVGVAPGTILYAVKILNRNGQGTWAHLLCGINWIIQNAERLNIKVGRETWMAADWA